MRITISKENYLKAIAEAQAEGEVVKAVTLTRWLHVSAPAVTMAIKRLKRDALIRVDQEGLITLTSAGREIASRLLNRHHLIERMLTEIFGLEWYKVHDEAEQLEHAVSTDFERKLTEKLGNGGACPHGNIVGMDSPEARRRRADAAQYIARCEHDAFGRKRYHQHADNVEDATGGDGSGRAEAIGEVADERGKRAH